jgi:hypothetical protein
MIERKNTLEWRQSLKPGDVVMIVFYGYNERSVKQYKVIKVNKVYITLEGGHEYTVSRGHLKGSTSSYGRRHEDIEPYDKDRFNDIRLEMDIRGYRTIISNRCSDIEKELRESKNVPNTQDTLLKMREAYNHALAALNTVKGMVGKPGEV